MELLRGAGVTLLVDVRTIPRSRRHPHFSKESLPAGLAPAGIRYLHLPALGGLRTPRPDSINTAWKHSGFRGYADHMTTGEFADGLRELESAVAAETSASPPGAVAVMCAEALPWKCHRSLLSDALVARGVEVRHLMGTASRPKLQPHALTAFAKVEGGKVSYPGLPLD